MANAVEQTLLLLRDMADLRSLRKHEVFLSLKRDIALESPLLSPFILKITNVLFLLFFYSIFFSYAWPLYPFFFVFLFFYKAVQAAHRAEELVNSSHRQMKGEEARHIATVDAFKVAGKKIQELNTQHAEADREKKAL